MLLLTALVFLTVVLALAGSYMWLAPSRTLRRLESFAPAPVAPSGWTESVVRMAGPFARLSVPSGNWEDSPLRIRFLTAGIRHEDARAIYFGAKTVLPVVFAGLAYMTMHATSQSGRITMMLYVMVAALVGCYMPNILLSWRISRRRRELFESFPDAADLMLICVEAGLGLDAGLTRVAEEMRRKSEALAEELQLTNLEMRAGGTREKALRNLALRTGVEEVATFATMLTQADRFGTSVGDSLRVFSDDLRHKRQVRAEEAAAKVPTKMLIPLVLCIFPAIIMVVMGPAVIQIIRTMGPMLTGR
jgi:tight adherence protein C